MRCVWLLSTVPSTRPRRPLSWRWPSSWACRGSRCGAGKGQAGVDAGDRPGVTTEDNTEIKKLKAENKRLREDVDILRAATVFFAGELDPRNR